MEHVEFESDESGDDVQAMDVKQTDNIPSCSNKPIRKRGKKNFIDDRMLACMDAGNMSSPLAIHFISATAKALGHNIEDLVLNCTSLREQRKKYRRRHGKEIIENFKVNFLFWPSYKFFFELKFFRSLKHLFCIGTESYFPQLLEKIKLIAWLLCSRRRTLKN